MDGGWDAPKMPNVGRHTPCTMVHHDGRRLFATLRTPDAWYESYYSMYVNRFGNEAGHLFEPDVWHPTDKLNKYFGRDIDEWVQTVLEEYPAFYTRMVESMIGQPNQFGVTVFWLGENGINEIYQKMFVCDFPHATDNCERNKSHVKFTISKRSTKEAISRNELNIYEYGR